MYNVYVHVVHVNVPAVYGGPLVGEGDPVTEGTPEPLGDTGAPNRIHVRACYS